MKKTGTTTNSYQLYYNADWTKGNYIIADRSPNKCRRFNHMMDYELWLSLGPCKNQLKENGNVFGHDKIYMKSIFINVRIHTHFPTSQTTYLIMHSLKQIKKYIDDVDWAGAAARTNKCFISYKFISCRKISSSDRSFFRER